MAPLVARGEPVHEDGLHLTGNAYRLVISALARLVAARGTFPDVH